MSAIPPTSSTTHLPKPTPHLELGVDLSFEGSVAIPVFPGTFFPFYHFRTGDSLVRPGPRERYVKIAALSPSFEALIPQGFGQETKSDKCVLYCHELKRAVGHRELVRYFKENRSLRISFGVAHALLQTHGQGSVPTYMTVAPTTKNFVFVRDQTHDLFAASFEWKNSAPGWDIDAGLLSSTTLPAGSRIFTPMRGK